MQWFKVCLSKYFDFNGRARRAEYWWFALIVAAVSTVLYVVAMVLAFGTGSPDPYTGQQSLGLGWIPMILVWIWGLAMFLPSLSVAVRRLHDTGRSGLFYLVTFIPFVGGFILLYFMVIDSTPGANQYGPNPKGVGNGGEYGQVGAGQYGQPQAYGQPQQQYGQPQQYGQ